MKVQSRVPKNNNAFQPSPALRRHVATRFCRLTCTGFGARLRFLGWFLDNMKRTSAFFWSLAICVLLSACNGQSKQSFALPSNTPKPSATVVPTQTIVKSTWTPSPAETSTATLVPPYPTKEVLLDYTIGGFHTPYEIYYADYGYDGLSELVLYTDGQLIIPGNPYQQKILSKDEINKLLTKLEALGFYTIESNQRHDPSDKLYNFGSQYQGVSDPMWYCVLINKDESRELCAWEPYKKFLVPEMKNILNFLAEYQVEGTAPYYPDRVLLWVRAGRSPYVENLPEKAIPWYEKFSSLETSDEKIMYFQGDEAKQIFALFGNEVSTMVISQNDLEYTVSIDIVLPHEQLVLP